MESKLNKYRSSLVVGGTGVILFGIWGFLKQILLLLLNANGLKAAVEEQVQGVPFIMAFVILLVLYAIAMGFYFFVGLSARSEGKTGKKRYVYLVLCILMIIVSAVNIVVSFFSASFGVLGMIAGILIDVTLIIALIDVFWSSIQVKKLKKIVDSQTLAMERE